MSRIPPLLERLIDEVVRRSGVTGSSAQELRADLERHFEEGLAAGRAPEELRRRFGDPARAARAIAGSPPPTPPGPRSTARSTWGGLLTDLFADLRHGGRTLLKRPGLALTTVLVFAIGIGANAVVFTIASELVLRPLAVEDAATLVDVWPDVPGGNSFLGFSWDDYTTYRDGTTTLETLAAFAGVRVHRGEAGEGEELVAQVVSPEYFPMLGLDAHLGSMRFPPDALFGEAHAAVLAYAVWRDAFGADPGIVGGTAQIDGTTVTILGVASPDFRGHFIGFPVDLWLPVTSAPAFMEGFDPADPASKPLEMIGRLRPGVGPAAAAAELNQIAEGLEARHPDFNRGHRVGVTPTTGVDHSLRASVDAFVGILVLVSVLVLIVACLNVGSVLLVRALARERDMAIRLAIGAGHHRLIRQLFTEAGMLAGLGAVSGVLLAVALNGWLAELVRTLTGGLGPELAIDGRTLAMTLGVALLAVLLAGGAPAFHVLRKDPAEVLRSRDGDRGMTARVRSALVVCQVAVSVVLLAATGLFVRSLTEGARAHPGFDADRVSSFTLDLRELESPAARAPVLRGVLEALRALPGVEATTVASAPAVGVARTPRGSRCRAWTLLQVRTRGSSIPASPVRSTSPRSAYLCAPAVTSMSTTSSTGLPWRL